MAQGRGAGRIALPAIAMAGAFVALAGPGAAGRGLVAEEIQPTLRRHPHVLEWSGGELRQMPPYEPGAPPRPRAVATSQWPVLAWDGVVRQWPILIRGHQSALGSYPAIALGGLLGGGPAGVRRTSVLLGLALIALTWVTARRLRAGAGALAAGLVAFSFGTIWICGTGYGFELASRLFMMAALAVAAIARPPGVRRAIAIGVLAGLAILARATVTVTLVPALAILLATPVRRPGARAALAGGLTAVALPLLALAAIAALAPLRPDAGPLAGFPVERLAARTARIPEQLLLQLAFVADASVVLAPLARGQLTLGLLAPAAALGALPFGAALVRWWQGRATDGERMFVCALLANVLAGAWLYGTPRQFQLALALEPLWALAVAEQLAALRVRRARWALALIAAACLLRGEGVARGMAARAHPGNPMLSGRTQHATVARLRALAVTGGELVTTTYNQAGVIEGWTDGAIAPLHAWRALTGGGEAGGDGTAGTWDAILRRYRPRYVLLSEGGNMYEGPFTDTAAIRDGLTHAAAAQGLRLDPDAAFPTESGAPGWSLVQLR